MTSAPAARLTSAKKIRQPLPRHVIAVFMRVKRLGLEAGHDAVEGGQARPLLLRRSDMPVVIARSPGGADPVDVGPPAAIGIVRESRIARRARSHPSVGVPELLVDENLGLLDDHVDDSLKGVVAAAATPLADVKLEVVVKWTRRQRSSGGAVSTSSMAASSASRMSCEALPDLLQGRVLFLEQPDRFQSKQMRRPIGGADAATPRRRKQPCVM